MGSGSELLRRRLFGPQSTIDLKPQFGVDGKLWGVEQGV